MAEQSKASDTAVPEPALRPKGMRAPGLDVVRNARLHADGRSLVVRDRRGRERRYPVGSGGIDRAVFFPPADVWETTTKQPAARWGVVVFQGADGRFLLQVPLAEWLPEAGATGSADLAPRNCLGRTGLKQLCDDLRIPLSESRTPWGRDAVDSPGGGRYDRAGTVVLPVWHGWVRGIGVFGWLVALIVSAVTDRGGDWALVAAAGALFLIPASDAVVRGRSWRASRSDALHSAILITPSPESGAGATRRFCERAALRVLPTDVVVTNTIDEESWYGRRGPHGIARLVRLTDPTTRAYLGAELRDADGEARALLPWQWWFAGPHGEQRWSELVEALDVPVSDEQFAAGGTGRADNADPWWSAHPLAGGARKMSPMPGSEARRATSWQESVIGGAETFLIPLFSALLLAGLFSEKTLGMVAGIISALTVVLVLGPALVHQLSSRFVLDRPGSPSEVS